MKRQNRIPGLIISLGISFIATSPVLLRTGNIDIRFLLTSILYNFLFCYVCWTAHKYLLDRKISSPLIRNRFLSGLAAITAVALLLVLYDWLFSKLIGDALRFQRISNNRRIYVLLFRGFLISGLFYFIVYHLHILAEKQKNSLEIERLKQANLEARLASLKEQLSPHFLFNTLNTLSSLTSEKNVKDYVSELANVYRYLLRYKEMNTATLEQELVFTESYLYIVKTRLEGAIAINIQLADKFMQSKIPPLTLQLLIENAIKHNVASASKRLIVEIRNEGGDYLVVQNNFQPKLSLLPSTGTGLNNIAQRYRLLFKKEILIEKNEKIFAVKLPII